MNSIAEQFAAWKATPGGRRVLRHAQRIAEGYGARYVRTGRRVSVKLIWELLRDRVAWGRDGLRRRGVDLRKVAGYRLNNIFTASVARHLLALRPEWAGLFELREVRGGPPSQGRLF